MATLFVGIGLGRFSYTALVPPLVESGQVSAAEAGYIGAFNLVGYMAGALAGPRLGVAFGRVVALRIALVIAVLGLSLCIFPFGFPWLMGWRFLLGVAGGVMMVHATAFVIEAALRGRLGRATGIAFTGVGLGKAVSGLLLPPLIDLGLAAAWAGLAVMALVAAIVAWGGWPPDRRGRRATPYTDGGAPRLPFGVLVLFIVYALYAVGLTPHTIFWIDYVARGLGLGIVAGGLYWAIAGLGAVLGPVLCGMLADRIGFAAALVVTLLALAAGLALPVLLTGVVGLAVSSFLFGALNPGISAVVSGRIGRLVPARALPFAWGRMTIAAALGQAGGGYALAGLFDWTASYAVLFWTGAVALAVGAVLAAPWAVPPRADR